MGCMRTTEDFADMDAGRAALIERGFMFLVDYHGAHGQKVGEHFRHPDRHDDGYWQRADLFMPYGTKIGRVSFWPATA